MPHDADALLQRQLEHLRASEFYAERASAPFEEIPFLTKAQLRESQRRTPPFGDHLCVPETDLVRMHVTSGTTGDPVAIGLTRRDHEANSAIGGEAFRTAGVTERHTIAHCLNYALYAGGIADHMALEATGATVVPVGVGQSQRLLDLIPKLGIDAIFGTLSYPAHLAKLAETVPRLDLIVTAGEAGAGLSAVREEIETTWGATVRDSFGMSDVWSTMAGECGHGRGLHLATEGFAHLEVIDPDTQAPLPLEDGVYGELVWTHLQREASPLLRYRSSDLAHVWTAPCPCGRTSPRIRIDGRLDDMLRVQAVNVYPSAIGELMPGRWIVVAHGDPITPPLRVYVEAGEPGDRPELANELNHRLRAAFTVTAVPRGSLPVTEQKTRTVYRNEDPVA